MPLKQDEKRRKILLILIGILLVMIVVILIAVICWLHFGKNQTQHMMQKIVSAKVIKHEEELLEIVNNLDEDETLTSCESDKDYNIYYADLDDKNVNRMFKTFNFESVSKMSGDGSVVFDIDPVSTFSFLWTDCDYGFYYTENDEPENVYWANQIWVNEMEGTEAEYTIEGFGRYHYRTEKITDNWWYYEAKWLWLD